MYQIYTHAAKGLKAHVQLNQVHQLRVPATVFAGIGDKKKKYMTYLEKNFTDGANLYHVMCELHVIAIQNGHIALLGHQKTKSFHADVLKEFMEKHLETLNLITPYVLPHETAALEKIKAHVPTKEGSIEVTDSIKKLITAPEVTADAPKAQLSDDDKNQIWALIQADQEQSGNVTERPAELQTASSLQEKSDVQVDVSAEDNQQTTADIPSEPVSMKIKNSSAFGSTGYAPDVKEWISNAEYVKKPLLECVMDPCVQTLAPQSPPTEGNEVKTLMPLSPPPEGCEVKY